MAGAMRKMAVYLGLVEDEDRFDEDYDEQYDGDGRDRAAQDPRARDERSRGATALRSQPVGGSVSAMPDRRLSATPAMHTSVAEAYRITTLHPRTYNEARTIGEHFREGTPVIMNLTDMDDTDAKRLVDFAAGLVFGLHGTIERVTNKVFLLSPANIEVTAEEKARLAEGGFFNQS